MTDSTTPASSAPAKAKAKAADSAAGQPPEAQPEPTPDQIQSDIDSAQRRLADHVDELSERLAPQALAEDALGSVKRLFVDADGSPKAKPIAIVAGTLTSLVVLRKIFHRD